MKLAFQSAPRPPHVAVEDWHNWQWQMRHRLVSPEDYAPYMSLQPYERTAMEQGRSLFKVQSTPYYTSLVGADVLDPIRQMIVPTLTELEDGGQQMSDPLNERGHSPTPRLVHRYPDRVLFLVTDTCGVYCRHCLRKYFTGKDEALIGSQEYERAIRYISDNRGIREVILSGGDPLTLSDSRLVQILRDLNSIEHIELIRIGTRMPVICPMRITPELVSKMKAFHPIYMMTHFNHPRELTSEAAQALSLLVDNGFPVFNQMVLLRGINNHAAIVQALSRRLLRLRVKPYYMHQCDPSEGTAHFRTSIDESLRIQKDLWGRLSGLAMPGFSVDLPGGGGKVGLVPNHVVGHDEKSWEFSGWDGARATYLSPGTEEIHLPSDLDEYINEWQTLKDQRYGDGNG